MRQLPPLRLTGATILRDGELRQRSVAIVRGRISKGPLPAIDLSGYLILPGIIDLMAEIPFAPGPAGITPSVRVKLAQSRAAAAGVTTAWMAVPWSWPRSFGDPAIACLLLSALARTNGSTDLRPAMRIEVSRTENQAELLDTIRRFQPGLVYLENRNEALCDLQRRDGKGFAHQARLLGLGADVLATAIAQERDRRREVPRHLCRIAETLDETGALYASLDDSGGEIRETYSMLGASIAACPAAYSAAAAAKAMGGPVLLSPHITPLATDVLRAGICDAMVSRGMPRGLAPRLLSLAGPGLRDLPRLWAMVSTRPAEIAGLADRGSLDHGRRADLTIIHRETFQIEATICAGRLTHLTGEAAHRFRKAGNDLPVIPIAAE